MKNKTFRLLITGVPPEVFSNCHKYPTFEPSFRCLFPGWVLEISQMIANYIDAEIIPVITTSEIYNDGYGTKINGTWKGFLGAVYDQEVDAVSTFYQYTDQRAEDFTFSFPVYNARQMVLSGIFSELIVPFQVLVSRYPKISL
uniref:Ionotropic glutamate receptor L-glutamate and glycine-binding domain-containing protein n=1 Tax=Panagrolaimus davidi TaxID=227884 RepID=A0A914QA02_9BILA